MRSEIEKLECLDGKHHSAVYQHHGDKERHEGSMAHAAGRGAAAGKIVVDRHIKVEYRFPAESKHGTSESVDTGCVTEYVDGKTCEKSYGGRPVGAQSYWQHYDDIDEYDRQSHIEQRQMDEYDRLGRYKQQKCQNYRYRRLHENYELWIMNYESTFWC